MKSVAPEPLKMAADMGAMLPSNAVAALKEFQLFPKLPIEIRLKIWEEHWGSAENEAQVMISPKYRYITSTRIPPCIRAAVKVHFCADSIHDRTSTLFVCKESREMTKRRFPNYIQMRRGGNQIRFNANRDTIVLDGDSVFQLYLLKHKKTPLGKGLFGFDKVKEVEIPEQFGELSHIGGQGLLKTIFTGVKQFKKGPPARGNRTLESSQGVDAADGSIQAEKESGLGCYSSWRKPYDALVELPYPSMKIANLK